MRSIILGSLLVFSIVVNIATVSVKSVAETVSGLFESVTGMGTVLGALGDVQSVLSKTEADLETAKKRNAQLTADLDTAQANKAMLEGDLTTERKRTARLEGDLCRTEKKKVALLHEVADLRAEKIVKYRGNDRLLKDAVGDTSRRISKRTATGASRNVAATFGEAWPIAGAAVIVTATTLELYDACVIMQDLHELDVAFNPNAAFGADAQAVCGMKVPSAEEIWAKVKNSPGEAWAKAKEVLPDLPDMPDIPGLWEALWSVDWELRNPLEGWEIRIPGQ